VREKYCWLAGAGGWCWFYVREKYYWLDAVKMKRTKACIVLLTWIYALSESRRGNLLKACALQVGMFH